jgi:CHAT domain-containing protein
MRQGTGRSRVSVRFAVFIVLSGLATVAGLRRRPFDPIRSLTEAVRLDAREIEPRLAGGFHWAPFDPQRHDQMSPSYKLASTVAVVLSGGTAPASSPTSRAVGVADLLAGRTRKAISVLALAAESEQDPRDWSDLSAAYYTSAERYAATELLADALAAADRALELDAMLPEALFNRALALERLGLRDDARQAWEQYLTTDAGSEWAAEAQAHVRRLAPEKTFREIVDRESVRLATDTDAARRLAQQFPQDARTFGVIEILARWADDQSRGDSAGAGQQLGLARIFGEELARRSGDRTLSGSVAAIDSATGSRRSTLAAAHVALRKARHDFLDNRLVEAETAYRSAAAMFEREGSPVALLAQNFVANAAFEQGRTAEAEEILAALLASAPTDLPAHRAQVLWQIAVCHASAGRWGDALRAANQSIALFERLGETEHAMIVRGIVAVIYDRIGDPATAWKHRIMALRGVGRRTNIRLQKAVDGIAQAAMLRRKWRTASSFLTVEIAISRRVKSDAIFADGLLLRAATRHRLGDDAAARVDLAAARSAVANIKDASYRSSAEADCAAVQAMLATSPSEAIALVTQAIDFHSTYGERSLLPALLLQRSRAYRRAGDPQNAASDLARGMDELESRRESLPQSPSRWGVFQTVDELFEDAIELALVREDARPAFAIAERARARSLLDSYGRSPSTASWNIAPGTSIVSFVSLPTALIIFTADASGVRAVKTPYDRGTLETESQDFIHALRADEREAIRRDASKLYRRLIQPIETQLAAGGTIVFVGDGPLATLPFGFLIDATGHHLFERHVVLAAPSTAVFAAAHARRHADRTPERVLIVTRSASDGQNGNLPSVAAEADRVARSYRVADRLDGDASQPADLARLAISADVIHFAGHAMGNDDGLEPASIVLSDGNGREYRLGVDEIAAMRLPRTSVVVLAGCSTARGERRGPEGVISVAYGFLAAGAPSVIATLWPIHDDDAAAFFPRVHAKMAEGLSPAEAVRAVQLECLRQYRLPPSMWAAVQVIGG